MYIRCPQCKTSTWAASPADEPDGRPIRVACRGCGVSHELDGLAELGATPEERHARAVEFADREGVDLASAYSMLLGLTDPLDAESELSASASAGNPPDDDEKHDAAVRDRIQFDPGFRKAVEQGLLTPDQARELGSRDAAATRMARRHGLPMQFALDVVDRRMPLHEAVSRAPRVRVEVAVVALPANRSQKAMVSGLVLLVSLALGVLGWNRWAMLEGDARRAEARTAEALDDQPRDETPAAPARPRSPAPDVSIDDAGRPLRVVAFSPRAVLDAFCDAAGSAGRYRAEGVASAAHGTRLGLVRDIDDLGKVQSILIRRDRTTGRWSAGNGLEPIVVATTPDAAGAMSVPEIRRISR